MYKSLSMNAGLKTIKKYAFRLAEADMVFWLMPPIMLILIAGTLAQRWMGLWPAIDVFFSTFIIWASPFSIPIPLPGTLTLLGILSLNLTLKFLLKSEWSWKKSGIILSHLGAIILLLGGLLTAATAREFFMLIPEGAQTPFIYSYSARELAIYEDGEPIAKLPYENIEDWDTSALPFKIDIRRHCINCNILKREESQGYDENAVYQLMARFMAFENKQPEPQPEINLTGIEFKLGGTDQDGIYIAFDGMPKPIEISMNDREFTLIFGKAQKRLPFNIALNDFSKQVYGGTETARSYHSDIVVKDGGLEWPTRIEMNKPLRYKGYTFFQSSFEQTPDSEATILAVVENKGRLFPYIGTFVIGMGLLLHLIIVIFIRKREHAK